jgi:hypothetical protein
VTCLRQDAEALRQQYDAELQDAIDWHDMQEDAAAADAVRIHGTDKRLNSNAHVGAAPC